MSPSRKLTANSTPSPRCVTIRVAVRDPAMRLSFRPATPGDFGYCATLYFAGMEQTIRELNLDMDAHVADFRRRWLVNEVRIVARDGADVGWLQSRREDGTLFLAQLFVAAAFQRQSIGTEVMRRLIAEAAGGPVTLGVVKTNPAVRLYERLGFRTTHEDERKFFMRREPDRHSGNSEQAMQPQEFVASHQPALAQDEVRHNLILSLLSRMPPGAPRPLPDVHHWTLGEPGACAVRVPPFAILLGEVTRAQAHALAERTRDLDHSGVFGPDRTAFWFTERARELGDTFLDPVPHELHALRDKPRYPGAPGHARAVGAADTELFGDWLIA